MDDDMQLAVIANIQKSAGTAFIPAQSMLTLQRKEKTGADASDSHQPLIRRKTINLQSSWRHTQFAAFGVNKAPTPGVR